MLKIYIQIFGTIALVAVILINYNIFHRNPTLEDIAAKETELQKLMTRMAIYDGIIVHENKMQAVRPILDKDRELIRLELPTTFSVPDRMARIYNLILASNLEYTGILLQGFQQSRPNATKITDFVPTISETEKFQASINAFDTAMKGLDGNLPAFLNASSPMDRLTFYDEMSKGVDFQKARLAQGFERYRFKLTLTGSYANIKKFLFLVANDKPLLQATGVRIVPKQGVGESRPFQLDCIIVAYADRNLVYEQMNQDPTALLTAKAPTAEEGTTP